MIHPDVQQTLFTTTKDESLILANTSESHASQWFNQGYLSFDITRTKELQYSELLELTFISKLFNSTLGLDTINKLLLLLAKPYAYSYQDVFFDIFLNEWFYLPKIIDQDEKDGSETDIEDIAN